MANLPSEIIFNIISRLPVRSLARFRFVSKLWCDYIDDPHLNIIHDQQYPEEFEIMIARTNFKEHPLISFYAIESQKPNASMFKLKQIQSLEFKCTQSSVFKVPYIYGSCNGLVYLSQDDWKARPCYLSVVNPVRKEYYELPPMDHPLDRYRFALHGLGFDDSTNTFKMVWLFLTTEPENVGACAMVHVFGTSSWRKIYQVLSNPIIFTRPAEFNKGVFACGCLHWLDGNGRIIRFDMRTEEFGLIDVPRIQGHGSDGVCDGLVDLHGEVGYVYCRVLSSLEVWVLKQKEWVIYCRFDHKSPLPAYETIAVLGRWNRDGDIFMKTTTMGVERSKQLFVYYRKSGLLKEVKLIRKWDDFCFSSTFIYPSSMYAIHGIKTYSIKN